MNKTRAEIEKEIENLNEEKKIYFNFKEKSEKEMTTELLNIEKEINFLNQLLFKYLT